MGEIGSRLREAREKRGLTLEQVEEATRIRRAFLEALEEEQFDKLPADVYARGFLRNYARFLGLDPDPLLKAYSSPQQKATLRLPSMLDEPLRKGAARSIWTALFWTLVVVVILGLGLWYGYHEFYLGTAWGPRATPSVIPMETLPPRAATTAPVAEDKPTATDEPVATLAPSATAAPSHTPTTLPPSASATAQVSPTASGAVTVGGTATATRSAVPSGSPTRGTPLAPTPATTASVAATPSAGPARSTPSPEDGIPVVIRISSKCYVYVAIDGTKVMEKILEQGDEQAWAFKRTFTMRVGNAAAVQVTLNGVDLPPVGKSGQVVTVEYTADKLPLN